ncbi:MAG: DegT/DnrJ/EryC1/StrS family aminotransferase [Sedimentisphaerales bacterium]|nr:DegT/DnrJ/EryC1/StrS family aminotransferase [Sedimentisphaerales bacterium]
MVQEIERCNRLALLGGEKSVAADPQDLFTWPMITAQHEEAVLKVLRAGQMSGLEVTRQFEKKYAAVLGRKYGLACPNGTDAILEAMYGMGIGVGDEIIAPSVTYWASVAQAYTLGATPIFADIDPRTLCIDPGDIEHRINERTKAIIVVHYAGMPADMDAIMEIAARYDLLVLEDCSHAHGALYKGRQVGTMGTVGAFSLMSGKSLAVGEGGIFFTDEKRIYERALLFGHYLRHDEITLNDLRPYIGIPCGGFKHRMHQLSSAMGLIQLDLYPKQMAEIDRAMNYFCDLLEDTAGLGPIRPANESHTTKGGWYYPHFHYKPEDLGGLSLSRFSEAVRAEGSVCNPGCHKPLHLHPLFTSMDVYGHQKPTRFANLNASAISGRFPEKLPVSESINSRTMEVPWFKLYRPDIIQEHANAYKKVAKNYKALLADDRGHDDEIGGYTSFHRTPSGTDPDIQ